MRRKRKPGLEVELALGNGLAVHPGDHRINEGGALQLGRQGGVRHRGRLRRGSERQRCENPDGSHVRECNMWGDVSLATCNPFWLRRRLPTSSACGSSAERRLGFVAAVCGVGCLTA